MHSGNLNNSVSVVSHTSAQIVRHTRWVIQKCKRTYLGVVHKTTSLRYEMVNEKISIPDENYIRHNCENFPDVVLVWTTVSSYTHHRRNKLNQHHVYEDRKRPTKSAIKANTIDAMVNERTYSFGDQQKYAYVEETWTDTVFLRH